ncbi:MAG: hypothetical protein KAT47_01780 [Candidatus Aegiribacteria sp.]|nr:hypothetical protein [Candidatus Aegiribacteria sp.]
MERDMTTEELMARYKLLKQRLAATDLIVQGTILERTITRNDQDSSDGMKAYGPYYQWTFKMSGKTVTVNLSESQAIFYQKAIDNNKTVLETLNEMRQLANLILEATTEGVRKRKAAVSI